MCYCTPSIQSTKCRSINCTPLFKDAVVMPRELTAENGAKHLMSGEFKIDVEHTCTACSFSHTEYPEECEVCSGEITYTQKHVIDWSTIKEIYAKAVKQLAV